MMKSKSVSMYSPLLFCLILIFDMYLIVDGYEVKYSDELINILNQLDSDSIQLIYNIAYDTLILNAEIKGQLHLYWK